MLLNPEPWGDFLKITKEFGYSLDDKPSSQNQKYLWEIIINFKKNIKDNLNQAIRANLQLCYMLDEHSQIKEINVPLYRLNYLLDHDFYRIDNDTYQALTKVHKMIIMIYKNIDRFIVDIKIIKENICFIRKNYNKLLIKDYNYLKNISLPLRGYEELRIALITILGKITQIKFIISDPSVFNILLEEIEYFRKCYISRYQVEHQRFQNELIRFYNELHKLPEYQALDCLSKIKLIKVAYNMKPIKKYIDTFFPDRCKIDNLEDVLDKQAKCSCGFTLGEALTIPSLNKIKPMLKKGIYEYIEQLQNSHFKALLNNYLSYNSDSSIKKILEFKPSNLEEILKYLDIEIINEINEALSNTYPIKISFAEISSSIIGTYPISQLELLSSELEKELKKIVRKKMAGVDNINYDEIIITIVK